MMFSIGRARNCCVDTKLSANRFNPRLPLPPLFARLFSCPPKPFFGSTALAGCTQSAMVTNKAELLGVHRQQASMHDNRSALLTSKKHPTVLTKNAAPFAPHKYALKPNNVSYGLASFYTEGPRTASGEKFDPHDLTAAHPTLPFGTRLRVTNVATGRSVTVCINDRGPFVAGRVVDLSYSAAETLGFIERGTARVKLVVVK